MTQKERVLMYIKYNGSITAADAMRDLGVSCLAERVRDLRKSGHDIRSTPEVAFNRFGELCHFVRYTYGGE